MAPASENESFLLNYYISDGNTAKTPASRLEVWLIIYTPNQQDNPETAELSEAQPLQSRTQKIYPFPLSE